MNNIPVSISIIPSAKVEYSVISEAGSWDDEFSRLHDIDGLELYTKEEDSLYAK